jgi:PPOX class probable F420-dependent enzyme
LAVRQSGTTIPNEFLDLVAAKTVAIVATIGPNGAPQASPVWFVWDGDRVRFRVSSTYQKYKNLQRDQRISVTIVDPARTDRYIELRGVATVGIDHNDELGNALARKYLDLDKLPWENRHDFTPAISVSIERVISMA